MLYEELYFGVSYTQLKKFKVGDDISDIINKILKECDKLLSVKELGDVMMKNEIVERSFREGFNPTKFLSSFTSYALIHIKKNIVTSIIINPNVDEDYFYQINMKLYDSKKETYEPFRYFYIPTKELFYFKNWLYTSKYKEKFLLKNVYLSNEKVKYTKYYITKSEDDKKYYDKLFKFHTEEKFYKLLNERKKENEICSSFTFLDYEEEKIRKWGAFKIIEDECEIAKEIIKTKIKDCLEYLGIYDFFRNSGVIIGGSFPITCLIYEDSDIIKILGKIGDIDIYPRDTKEFVRLVNCNTNINWEKKKITNKYFSRLYFEGFPILEVKKNEIKYKVQLIPCIYKDFKEDVLSSYDSTLLQVGYDCEKEEVILSDDFIEDYKKGIFRHYSNLSKITQNKDRKKKIKNLCEELDMELEENLDKKVKNVYSVKYSEICKGGYNETECKKCERCIERKKHIVGIEKILNFSTDILNIYDINIYNYSDIFPWEYTEEYLEKKKGEKIENEIEKTIEDAIKSDVLENSLVHPKEFSREE